MPSTPSSTPFPRDVHQRACFRVVVHEAYLGGSFGVSLWRSFMVVLHGCAKTTRLCLKVFLHPLGWFQRKWPPP